MSISSEPDRDVLFDELLAARPDVPADCTDARSPSALALRSHIVHAGRVTVLHRSSGRGQRRRRVGVGMVAAAAAVALVVTMAGDRVGLDGPPPAAASIDEIVAASQEALRGDGRATVTWEETWPDGRVVSGDNEVAFSGDDVDIVSRVSGDYTEPPGSRPIHHRRLVDGELYLQFDDGQWVHDILETPEGAPPVELFSVDPRPLLQALQSQAGFTLVGDEELDGRPVRHLRASAPGEVRGFDLGQGWIQAGSIDQLDVWVDEDDVIHRLDVAMTRNGRPIPMRIVDADQPCPEGSRPYEAGDEGSQPQTRLCQVDEEPLPVPGAYSVRFHDLGTPVPITAPPDAVDAEPFRQVDLSEVTGG